MPIFVHFRQFDSQEGGKGGTFVGCFGWFWLAEKENLHIFCKCVHFHHISFIEAKDRGQTAIHLLQ